MPAQNHGANVTEAARVPATQFYCAPEFLLHSERYTQTIEVWSLGCIFADLLDNRLYNAVNTGNARCFGFQIIKKLYIYI